MNTKIKTVTYILTFLCLISVNCTKKTTRFRFKYINEREYGRLKQIDSGIYEHRFVFKKRELGNRYSFFRNGNLKEYCFLNNDSQSAYIVKFDSIKPGNVTKIYGDPFPFVNFYYDRKKRNLSIEGLACTLISDSIKIAVTNLNNNMTVKFNTLPYATTFSRYILFFFADIPLTTSTTLKTKITAYSDKLGDTVYENEVLINLSDTAFSAQLK